MRRFTLCGLLITLALFAGRGHTADNSTSPKDALKELNDFIGTWKGTGEPVKPRPTAQEIWSETVSWTWRFKADDAWLAVTFKDGKYLKSGDLRYLADKKRYQLSALDKADKKLVFEGEFKDSYLKVERVDADKKETQRLTMNLAGDGVRLIYLVEHKPEGGTLYVKDYKVACTKEGQSLGAKKSKIECIVSGGLGTIPVTYKGETYYVCCSGCKDAFNETPEKYVAEYKAKKGKK